MANYPRRSWRLFCGPAAVALGATLGCGPSAVDPKPGADAGADAGACARPAQHAVGTQTAAARLIGSAWPEADRLFRSDPRWRGSDAAYSVDLGCGRTLWLFGDTFIAAAGSPRRAGSRFVRNSVGIQTGYNPAAAQMRFYWGTDASGAASSFFPNADADWYWPLHGLRAGGKLVLFLARIRESAEGLGFAAAGWRAVVIDEPEREPSAWRPRNAQVFTAPFIDAVGAGVLARDGRVYAIGSRYPRAYLLRWSAASVAAGDLSAPEWWNAGRWVAHASLVGTPAPLLGDAQTELTLHDERETGRVALVQTVGFGAANVTLRRAAAPTGPFGEAQQIYHPPESDRPSGDQILVYAGKAHPQLSGADLVGTYAANSLDFNRVLADETLYYPRFFRANYAR